MNQIIVVSGLWHICSWNSSLKKRQYKARIVLIQSSPINLIIPQPAWQTEGGFYSFNSVKYKPLSTQYNTASNVEALSYSNLLRTNCNGSYFQGNGYKCIEVTMCAMLLAYQTSLLLLKEEAGHSRNKNPECDNY